MTVKQRGSADVSVSLFEEENGPCVRNFTCVTSKIPKKNLLNVHLGVKRGSLTRFHWKAKDSLGGGFPFVPICF